ncbi:hypothetical protein [Paenibacillus thiaminolyticus]|nr:hypothetical protein [Paenibacillus thiaminolyticus]
MRGKTGFTDNIEAGRAMEKRRQIQMPQLLMALAVEEGGRSKILR